MARRELHHTGGEGNEKAHQGCEPDEEDARAGRRGRSGPAHAEAADDVEEDEIAKTDAAFERSDSGHVRRSIAERRWPEKLNFAEILEQRHGCIATIHANHAAARMSTCPAQIEATHRRARGQALVPHVRRQALALENVAASEADLLLDVRRPQHL